MRHVGYGALIACCLISPHAKAGSFEEPPSYLSQYFTAVVQELTSRGRSVHFTDKGCVDVEAKRSRDGLAGQDCEITIGGVDLYAVGSKTPSQTRMLQLIAPRELLREDLQYILSFVVADYDPDFYPDR